MHFSTSDELKRSEATGDYQRRNNIRSCENVNTRENNGVLYLKTILKGKQQHKEATATTAETTTKWKDYKCECIAVV